MCSSQVGWSIRLEVHLDVRELDWNFAIVWQKFDRVLDSILRIVLIADQMVLLGGELTLVGESVTVPSGVHERCQVCLRAVGVGEVESPFRRIWLGGGYWHDVDRLAPR